MADDTARITAIETDVVSRTADDADVGEEELADALEVIDADLRGRHSEFEEGSYVTVEDRRAYAVDPARWEGLLDPHGFDDALAAAVRDAHHRQAEALFVASEGDSSRLDGASGVVVGIDTAERFE